MKSIVKKMKLYMALQDEIDSFIHKGLYAYLQDTKQNFSGPEGWTIDEDFKHIKFYGEDGCMGCYDRVSFYVPMRYFGLSAEDFE